MINKKNIREYLGTIITIAAAVLIMFGTLVFIHHFLQNNRIENRSEYLEQKARISAMAVSNELELFVRDVHFFLSSLSDDELQNLNSGRSKRNVYTFLVHNKDLINEINIYDDQKLNIRLNTSGDLQTELSASEVPDYIDANQEVEFRFIPERDVLIYDAGTRIFEFKINFGTFIINRLETYFYNSSGLQRILYPEGSKSVGENTSSGYFDLSQKLEDKYMNYLQDGISKNDQGKVRIGDDQVNALISFYPVDVFNKSYGIVLAVPKSEVVDDFRNSFLLIAGIMLLLTISIVITLTRNIRDLQSKRNKLRENQKQLKDLVDQQKLLFEYSQDFTYRHDEHYNYDYVSENVQKVLGYTPEEFSGSQFRQFTQNPLNKAAREATAKVLNEKSESENFYAELKDKYGKSKILEIKEKPFKLQSGKHGVIGIAKDVTEKFMSDQKFRMLFEYSSDPHLIYDHDRGIIDCNDAVVKIFDAPKKEAVIGESPAKLSPERQPDGRLSEYKADEMVNLASEKGRHTFEWTHQKLTGKNFPVEITLTPVVLNDEHVILAVLHDLTERKRVEEVLIEGREKAESLARSKQQFLSSMSHEIRTPLNAVVGYTKFLMDENPRSDQMEKLKSLKFSADNLMSLVSDILDHSIIESGKIKFAKEKFSIKERLNGVAEMMKMKAEDKNLEINLDIDEEIPEYVIGDPTRLNQIMVNLCGNAVKFTEKGYVAIKAGQIGKSKDHHEIKITVRDTGIGIPEDRKEAIFDTFEQADLKILNTYGGTGLGLSITKNLVEMQGGSINVESEEGKGSSFTVVLNFKRDNSGTASEKKQDTPNDLSGAKILLVEDNPINQKIAEQFLKKWGAKVTIAEDGKEGLGKVSEKGFDFVLMDIQMPEMDGYETTRAIRKIEDDYFQKLPIICLTADAFTEVRERVLEAGMNDYVTKPIDSDQFFKTISRYYKPK